MLNRKEMIEKLVEHSIETFYESSTRNQEQMLREVFEEDWSKSTDEELLDFCIDYNFIEDEENVSN